ncbi:hypothetical protein BHM03_00020061 [Ensete ventricosum]|nr:hypothetical protein BHM03_00020061 [Ensete ventricosum]
MHFLIQVAYGFDSGDQSRQSVICEPSVTVPSHQDPYSPGIINPVWITYLLFFVDVAVLFIHLFPQLELVISILALVLDFILIDFDTVLQDLMIHAFLVPMNVLAFLVAFRECKNFSLIDKICLITGVCHQVLGLTLMALRTFLVLSLPVLSGI